MDSAGLFTALLDRFATLGGVDLELPDRAEPARATLAARNLPDFDGTGIEVIDSWAALGT